MGTMPVIDSRDWISIHTGCFGVTNAIAKTSSSIRGFIREVRESRSDLDVISSELHSLDGIVDLLKDDAESFPPQLAHKTPAVLDNCLAILHELEGCISVLDRCSESRADKKSRWLASQAHIGKLRWTLDGYKSTLGLAVDLVGVTNPHKNNKQLDSLSGEFGSPRMPSNSDYKNETAKVAESIKQLTSQLEHEAQQNGAVARLQHYLEALHTYAVTAIHLELHQVPEPYSAPSSVEDPPDSAIELSSDDQGFPVSKWPRHPRSPSITTPVDEHDELLDELREMPGEAPIPPPRSMARRGPVTRPSFERPRPSTSDTYSVSVSSVGRSPGQSSSIPSFSRPRVSHMRSWSFSPSDNNLESTSEGASTPGTEISSHSYSKSSGASPEKVRPDSATIGQPFIVSRATAWENPRAVPSHRPSTSSSSMTTGTQDQSPMVRRSSSRLSTRLRSFSFGMRRSSSRPPEHREAPHQQQFQAPQAAAPAIFGVSLVESMQVAKGIGHDGYGSSGARTPSSTRGYPLCVLRCVYFIQDHGLEVPHIFGQDGDHILLANLKDIFSSFDTGYGKILDWNCFTVHEAADLILLFLSELPTPLVPEVVAKRWVSLSRQATVAGSMALRLDQGIDFWEEAFSGIHGPSRALLRLLLNLWGDIADLAEVNDMTAERLAGRIMRPIMHLPAARYDTDLMLGLAFMIRKRSEYRVKARGVGRKSNAAF
ncbi:putative RhoGAP group protein [Apodospora peruviana]|uniref:RhoGAP group protein n=1 Tax=Apodospora peruviana TaxID=516989 RepID=A0AAE0IQN8_9PEZI|nr:putative RhoGAP group protein [Apodospora peruviana]